MMISSDSLFNSIKKIEDIKHWPYHQTNFDFLPVNSQKKIYEDIQQNQKVTELLTLAAQDRIINCKSSMQGFPNRSIIIQQIRLVNLDLYSQWVPI